MKIEQTENRKKILKVLQENERLTRKEIQAETNLSDYDIKYGLRRLQEADIIQKTISLGVDKMGREYDTRGRFYFLKRI